MLKRYADWSPTECVHKGAFLTERGDWLVAPVIHTRDSGPIEESNFNSALNEFGGESDTVEVHRFGHWGPGWFEIILVAPGSEAQTIAEDIYDRLQDYPILDDDDHSAREFEEACEAWKLH